MLRPVVELEGVQHATSALLRTLEHLTDRDAADPSLLPGWTRAEVIAHLARNADSQLHMVEAAARGEVADQYPGGPAQRERDIAAGRGRDAAELVDDLHRSCGALAAAWESLADDVWDRATRPLAAPGRSVAGNVWARLREVEVHHADLDLGYTPIDWPVRFVTEALDRALTSLAGRADPNRPLLDACVVVTATDHEREWIVLFAGPKVEVVPGGVATSTPDAIVSGWGCDLLAWLLGRRPAADTVTVAGEQVSTLRLPDWFPFA